VEASARAQAEASRETTQQLAAAEVEAARIRQSSNEQLDALLAEIVTAVRIRLAWLDRQ
jgi:F0F1-type ATP synthase membrane subunit b/b'